MLVSFSFVLLKYLRKACILFWLLGLLACKDFKNWESRYGHEVKITFELEKDEWAPEIAKDLGSYKLSKQDFIKQPIVTDNDEKFLLTDPLTIPLDPDANEVSFELKDKNNIYYHSVTIYYKRMVSLISPEAGGLQIQYVIKPIQLGTKNNKRPIFKKFKIENPVPLKEEKDKTHVTLYY